MGFTSFFDHRQAFHRQPERFPGRVLRADPVTLRPSMVVVIIVITTHARLRLHSVGALLHYGLEAPGAPRNRFRGGMYEDVATGLPHCLLFQHRQRLGSSAAE